MRYPEKHRSKKIGWLRAAVLGADDGILSTASMPTNMPAIGDLFDLFNFK